MPFSSHSHEVAQQVRHWRQVDENYRVPRSTLALWLSNRDDIEWTPDSQELALRSALKDRSFPNYWAQALPEERLLDVVEDLIVEFSYPERESLPYLICSQLWDLRQELFDRLRRDRDLTRGVPNKWSLQKLEAMSRADYLCIGRCSFYELTWHGRTVSVKPGESNQSDMKQVFTQMVLADAQTRLDERPFIHQLDIALHHRRS